MSQPKPINRQKASSHPLSGGQTYKGIIRSFANGRPVVYIDQLQCTFNDVEYLGNTNANQLSVNDWVLCTFIEGQTRELFVLGPYTKKTDVFTTVVKFNALIDELESRLGLSSTALEAFKQT